MLLYISCTSLLANCPFSADLYYPLDLTMLFRLPPSKLTGKVQSNPVWALQPLYDYRIVLLIVKVKGDISRSTPLKQDPKAYEHSQQLDL
jgi:hypothetical protein